MTLFAGITLPGHPDYENVRKLDLLPMPAIMEMMRVGFAVDIERLRDLGDKIDASMKEVRKEVCSYIPEDKLDEFMARSNLVDDDSPMNVDSNVQLAELLFNVLKIGDGKQLKRTKSGKQISTGKRQMEQLRHEHAIIGKTLEYKELSKLKSSFCDSLLQKVIWNDQLQTYRVHTEILSTRTAIGRLASKNPNLQQIPIRTELGRLIRSCFIASPGKRLVDCDFSQSELRMLAHLAKALSMIKIYNADGDIHDNTARVVFDLDHNVKPDVIDHRWPSKRVNFGIQNGTTEIGLYAQLVSDYGTNGVPIPDWLTQDWCKWFIERWLESYPEANDYFELQHNRAFKYELVWDAFGRVRRIPEVRSTHERIIQAGLRQAQNMPITATSAGLMKLAIAEVQQFIETELRPQGVYCYPLLTIHDAEICEIDEDYAEVFKDVMVDIFSNVLTDKDTGVKLCRVPIKADAKVMQVWEK